MSLLLNLLIVETGGGLSEFKRDKKNKAETRVTCVKLAFYSKLQTINNTSVERKTKN